MSSPTQAAPPKVWQNLLVETFGVFVLVAAIAFLANTMSASLAEAKVPHALATMITVVVVAVGASWALSLLASSLGWRFDAEFNPAVTLGVLMHKLIAREPARGKLVMGALSKMACQVVGGVGAILLLALTVSNDPMRAGGYAVPTREVGLTGPYLSTLEGLGTAILVWTVLGSIAKRNDAGDTGSNIGRSLGLGILITGYWTGGGLNPARSLAPMIVTGNFTDWQYYTFAPFVGAIVATGLYSLVNASKS